MLINNLKIQKKVNLVIQGAKELVCIWFNGVSNIEVVFIHFGDL